MQTMQEAQSDYRRFYEREYAGDRYSAATESDRHYFGEALKALVDAYGLREKRCLEVGCGRGAFQDLVPDYVGIDIASSAGRFLHRPFCVSSGNQLPFGAGAFGAVWTHAVLEHVPDPERSLAEMCRVLGHGGLLLLAPAWFCRSWAAQGYPVRPYKNLGWRGKIVKATLPIRNAVLFRALFVFPRRLLRMIGRLFRRGPTRFRYGKLKPNYDRFWMSDSDALNHMDPHEAILWFRSRGHECLTPSGALSQFFVRTGVLVFRIIKSPGGPAGRRDFPKGNGRP